MHESVLLQPVLEALSLRAGITIIDGTIGYGGHTRAILEATKPSGIVIGFDKDAEAIRSCEGLAREFPGRVRLIHEDYRFMARALGDEELGRASGVLLDLGVSSPQLDQAERGFSFLREGPLDMRMDRERNTRSARELVARAREAELKEIFSKFGEEKFSGRIARRIVEERAKRPLQSTKDLEEIIYRAVPAPYRHGRVHPATRVFQALRIAVNDELGALEGFLREVPEKLGDEARVAIISFHSLEDRIVKDSFMNLQQQGAGKVLTRKPLVADEAEIEANPRSRSAKLRVFERSLEEIKA